MKSKKILLVQFRTNKALILNEQKTIFRYFLPQTRFRTISALDSKIDFFKPKKILRGINAVILGGSGEFNFSGGNGKQENIFWKMVKRVTPFIQYLLKKDIPTLGICFGHQFLGYALGVKVVADKPQQEIGSFYAFLTSYGKKSQLFFDLPQRFVVQCGHKDSLEKLPKGAYLLAKTKKCKIAAFQYKNNIYGLQFHPELKLKDLIFRLKFSPSYLGGGEKKFFEIKKRLKPSPFSPRIFKNFSKIISCS